VKDGVSVRVWLEVEPVKGGWKVAI